ncbi:hypothetical protein TNCV_3965051 [Trichonephila clavipes]|nr:hypothetical protein TNCV_3965051 [Trichonephila clavipes]
MHSGKMWSSSKRQIQKLPSGRWRLSFDSSFLENSNFHSSTVQFRKVFHTRSTNSMNRSQCSGDSSSKTEKTSKETHIECFYRIKEIASRINREEEAEKFYIIKGLKENRSTERMFCRPSCKNN